MLKGLLSMADLFISLSLTLLRLIGRCRFVHGGVWTQLQDINEAFGLRYQWGGSYCNKALLCCLGIDTRNIVSPPIAHQSSWIIIVTDGKQRKVKTSERALEDRHKSLVLNRPEPEHSYSAQITS